MLPLCLSPAAHSWLALFQHSLGCIPLFCELLPSKCRVRVFLQEWSFVFLADLQFSWSASAGLCQPPQGIWKQSAPALFLRPPPWSPRLHTQRPARCRQMWAHELLLSWEVPFSTVFVVNFLRFAFRAHVTLFSPLRFQSFSDPSVRGFPMCGNLLSSCLPSPGFSYPSQNRLSPFSLPNSNEIDLPFWKSEVLCQHSKDVLWEMFYMWVIFLYICEGEVVLPSYSSPILKVFWNRHFRNTHGALKSDRSVNGVVLVMTFCELVMASLCFRDHGQQYTQLYTVVLFRTGLSCFYFPVHIVLLLTYGLFGIPVCNLLASKSFTVYFSSSLSSLTSILTVPLKPGLPGRWNKAWRRCL